MQWHASRAGIDGGWAQATSRKLCAGCKGPTLPHRALSAEEDGRHWDLSPFRVSTRVTSSTMNEDASS